MLREAVHDINRKCEKPTVGVTGRSARTGIKNLLGDQNANGAYYRRGRITSFRNVIPISILYNYFVYFSKS